jgi:predicted nucleic acid-binding Zn ribbon protein
MAFSPIKQALENVLKEYNIKEDLDVYKIFHLWTKIVGDKTARHTKPVRIGKNTLFVEVDDPLWLTQLRYMRDDIMDKIDSSVKKGVLTDVKFYLKRN